MALTITDRGTKQVAPGVSATNTLTCNAFTPAAGSLIGAAVALLIDDANAHSSFSASDGFTGTGTWNQTTTVWDESTFSERSSIFYALAGGSPGTATITITRTAGSHDQWFCASFFEISGQNSTPIGATGTNSNQSATTLTITLGAAPASSSLVISTVYESGQGAGNTGTFIVAPSGWTMLADTSDGGNASEMAFAYKNGSSIQAPQWSGLEHGGAGGGKNGGVALEVVIAGSGGGGTITMPDVYVPTIAAQQAASW